MACLAPRLIDAASTNVANPFDDVVVAVVQLGFKHLQVAHLEPRRCKGYLRGAREVSVSQSVTVNTRVALIAY